MPVDGWRMMEALLSCDGWSEGMITGCGLLAPSHLLVFDKCNFPRTRHIMIVHDYDPMWLQAAVGIFLFHSICTAFIFTTNPFQYNRALDLSLSSTTTLSRRTYEHCNTPAQDKAFSHTCFVEDIEF